MCTKRKSTPAPSCCLSPILDEVRVVWRPRNRRDLCVDFRPRLLHRISVNFGLDCFLLHNNYGFLHKLRSATERTAWKKSYSNKKKKVESVIKASITNKKTKRIKITGLLKRKRNASRQTQPNSTSLNEHRGNAFRASAQNLLKH